MDKSKIKELLIKARESSPERYKAPSFKKAYRSLKGYMKKEAKSENGRWLFENFYLFEESFAEIKKEKTGEALRYFSAVLSKLLTPDNLKDGISALFEVLSDDAIDDFKGVRAALISDVTVNINLEARSGGDVSKGINTIRALREFDFTPYLLGYTAYENYLRRDPSYMRLDGATRALYKEKIKRYSKKKGLTFTEGVKRIVEEAEAKNCHIGELLGFSRGKWWYLLLFYAIYHILSFISFKTVFSVFEGFSAFLLFLLTLIPLRSAAFSFFAPIVSRLEKSEILPRLDMPYIEEKYATLVVITTLFDSEEEVKNTFSKLENISLKSRTRGRDDGFLYYGIIADLKGSDRKTVREDETILKRARSETDRLNKIYGERFLFFYRERRFSENSGRWEGHERKRGAINAVVENLSGMKSDAVRYGAKPVKIKYIVTLDSDTDIPLGAVNKMVGTMAHPLNHPVIEDRGGAKRVKSGYGILQPNIAVSIDSAHLTPFATLISGGGGIDAYHGAVFNLNQILFGRGAFCGKGIFDVDAFREVLLDAFPDGTVLSHDLLEGSRLSVGSLTDVTFFDSVPTSVPAFFNRAHRWSRGDIQNLIFLLPLTPSKNGYVRNPMRLSDRLLFINNLLSILTPISSFLGLFLLLLLGKEASGVVLLLVLYSITPFIIEVLSGRVLTASRRFFGDTIPALAREGLSALFRLSSLFFVAYKNSDALLRSLYRMTVSKKNLLEWTTANTLEKGKNGFNRVFLYTFPSIIGGVVFLIFSKAASLRLIAILWLFFPFSSFVLSKKRESPSPRGGHLRTLERYARDIWRFFERYVDGANNFLPPDNVSVFPKAEIASRTSPTNIGLYLLSVLAALDFGFITPSSAADRLELTLSSIEKLPKYKGQLYNWYSTVTLETVGKEYISTVDSGNFVTSLVALYEGLSEYESADGRIKRIRERIKKIEEESDFKFLYSPRRELFSLGFFPDKEMRDGISYDTYMSEARTTDYYAIARGIASEKHWSALQRPIRAGRFSVGALSWSGTAFEYFMPQLLLPSYKNSFLHEALVFAFAEQVSASVRLGSHKVFGVSESGYFAFDDALNYQYRAFGIPALSRNRESEGESVISPYSTFLMMRMNPTLCLKNLKTLEKLGLYGECGFYEALDLTPSRVGSTPSIVKSFMCHHLGMSLVALANASFNDVFVKRFMKDREMSAVSELLKESVPADAVSKRVKKRNVSVRMKRDDFEKKGKTFRTAYGTGFISGKDHTLLLTERGVASERVKLSGEYVEAIRPLSSTNPASLFIFATDGDTVFSPSFSDDVSFAFDGVSAEYKTGALTAVISLSAKTTAMRIKLETSGREGVVGIYLEPVLRELSAYLSHPAYTGIFFTADYDKETSTLFLSSERNGCIALSSSGDFTFEVSREKLFDGDEYSISTLKKAVFKDTSSTLSCKIPLFPCIFAKSSYTSKAETTFIIGYGRTRGEALFALREEKNASQYKSIERAWEFYKGGVSASGFGEVEPALSEMLISTLRPDTPSGIKGKNDKIYTRNALYSLGISGDFPIFAVSQSAKSDELERIIRLKKLHYIMGARYDLVLEVSDMGYQRGGRREKESVIERAGAGFLINKRGGIFFADVSDREVSKMLSAVARGVFPPEEKLTPDTRPESFEKYPQPLSDDTLLYGFDDKGYTMNLNSPPPLLQSHIIAHETFGTLLSHRSLGTTWAFNSRLGRITYFENDATSGAYGERVIMKRDGCSTNLTLSASAVRFSAGSAEYIGPFFKVRVAVHPKLLFKAVSVRVDADEHSLQYLFTPVLDDFERPITKIEYSKKEKNAVEFKNLFSDFFKKGFGYLYLPFEKNIFFYDGKAETEIRKSGETLFVIGYAGSDKHFSKVKEYFRENSFDDLLRLSEKSLLDKVSPLTFNSQSPLSSFFLPYQTLVSRFYARSGPYQSGGAWGFRDAAQDSLTVIDSDEKAVRRHIFRMAYHQFEEGDVEHWWHYGRGVKTRCSDDYLWFVWLLALYIEKTGDRSILDVEIPYLEGRELLKKEKDRYAEHKRSKVKESVLSHARRALDLFIKRGVGEHSLPFILSGDWNDAMSDFPEGSESVWLAFFGRIVISLYLKIIEEREEYAEFSKILKKGIDSSFFSDRYARVILPDGRVEGIKGGRIEIDAISQAFSSICHAMTGDGDISRITLALDSLWRELYDEERRILRLFKPPFNSFKEDVGYLSAYPEGIRENGGQYTHAAVWSAMAFLLAPDNKEENRKRALTLALALSPHSRGEEYKTEPYVLAGDVYYNESAMGHGGWSWYTGAASWYRKLLLMLQKENRNNSSPFS